MKANPNKKILVRSLLIGCLIAILIYLFHPATGQFSMLINGEPVAEPMARFAVMPVMIAILFFTGLLMLLSFFGVGLLLFFVILMFLMGGVFFMVPFFWPLLVIIILMIGVMSVGEN